MRQSLIAAEQHAKATNARLFHANASLHQSSSTLAMFNTVLACLFLVPLTSASRLQLATPSLLNASSLDCTRAPHLNPSNIFECFAPSFPPPGPLHPITYSECTDAADKMMANVRADLPAIFNRSEKADIQLPWRVRSGNCMMALDVLDKNDEDIMCIRETHDVALALCRICVSGYYRYGGRTPVGPRQVVYISVYATGPATGSPTLQSSDVTARQIELRSPGMLDTSSLATTTNQSILDSSNTEEGECFSESGPTPRRHLYPVKSLDCFNAAHEMLRNRRDHVTMTFGRRATGAGLNFKLPWTARNNSCLVTVDTLNNDDFDTIVLWEVYSAALDRIEKCTTGEEKFGGRLAVGPKKVVYVYVFGIGSPLQIPISALSAPTHIVARAQIENTELNLLNASSPQTTDPTNSINVPTTNASTLHGIPECFDAPLPRERSVPISNFSDCEAATYDIVGARIRTQLCIFSRKPSTDLDHYQLPATFRTGTCVVHLDMEYPNAEDTVRLSYVESTAWVLAHKCSGLEKPGDKWGGTMTVSVGAKDLIRVWVYGVVGSTVEEPSGSRVASVIGSE